MSTTIKPTVGRVVWFYPPANAQEGGFARPDEGQPLAAIVTRVWSDRMLNLTVFDANGVPHGRTSVQLLQEGELPLANGYYATWMPYQVGQAKKQADETAANTPPSRLAAHATIDVRNMLDRLIDAGHDRFVDNAFGKTSIYTIEEIRAELISRNGGQIPVDNAFVAAGAEQFSAEQIAAAATGTMITFEQFVQHGRDQKVPLVRGMPWSFSYFGHPVTHENDQCYLVMTAGSVNQLRFTPDDVLCTGQLGELFLRRADGHSGSEAA